MDEWIPVGERLPFAEPGDVSEQVLVTDGENVAIVEWFNFEVPGPFWGYTGFGKDVTHWMPLPEPPKETPAAICQTCGNFETCPWQNDENLTEYIRNTEGRVVACSEFKDKKG